MAALKQNQLFIAYAPAKADNADAVQLAEFLERAPRFAWKDLASHDPATSEHTRKLATREAIAKAQCLLLPVGVYIRAKPWAQFQIQCAKEAGIPIVAIKPTGGKVVPFEIQADAVEVVPWSPKDMAKAIRSAIKDAAENPIRPAVTESHAQSATKSAALRQAQCRANRHKAGTDGNGQRQLNTWLDTSTALALERIAKRDGVTKRQALERLIRDEDERILKGIKLDSPEWKQYFGQA